MSFDKVMASVEDIKGKFAEQVGIPTPPLLQGLQAFHPELALICDAELSVSHDSRCSLPTLCAGLGGGFGRFADCGLPALLNPSWTSPTC